MVGWQVFELTRDPLTLGLIGLAEALPYIAVALYAGHVADRTERRALAIGGTIGLVLSAVALLLLTVTPGAITAGRVWPVYGVCDNVSVVIRSTLLQMRTPEAMMGRVSAVNQIFIGASNEIGAFESGVAARLMGVVPSVIFGGCMTLLVVAVTAWRSPQVRRLREL